MQKQPDYKSQILRRLKTAHFPEVMKLLWDYMERENTEHHQRTAERQIPLPQWLAEHRRRHNLTKDQQTYLIARWRLEISPTQKGFSRTQLDDVEQKAHRPYCPVFSFAIEIDARCR